MTTFADYLECVADEPIICVVIGKLEWDDYWDDDWDDDWNSVSVPNYRDIPKGQVLPWSEGRKWLEFKTSYGFGSPKQPAVYCYTENYVIFMTQYDGATSASAVPRNPINIMPEMPGGG